MIRFVTLYFTLVVVGTFVIVIGTNVSPLKALATAATGCLLKAIAVRLHDFTWATLCGKACGNVSQSNTQSNTDQTFALDRT
jgi:hypothetical protein